MCCIGIRQRKEIDEAVKKCIPAYATVLPVKEQAELSHLFFSTSYIAEKVGFEVDVWFMSNLLVAGKNLKKMNIVIK